MAKIPLIVQAAPVILPQPGTFFSSPFPLSNKGVNIAEYNARAYSTKSRINEEMNFSAV